MKLSARSLLLLLVVVEQTYGAIYDQISQLPTFTYDYIIVGGTLSMCHTVNQREGLIRHDC